MCVRAGASQHGGVGAVPVSCHRGSHRLWQRQAAGLSHCTGGSGAVPPPFCYAILPLPKACLQACHTLLWCSSSAVASNMQTLLVDAIETPFYRPELHQHQCHAATASCCMCGVVVPVGSAGFVQVAGQAVKLVDRFQP